MGPKLSLSYFVMSRQPVAVGVGSNINNVQGVASASINVVSETGPFDKFDEKSGQKVMAKSLWENERVVVHLLRRFGCPLCRKAALEISSIGPILKSHNVRLVGIGLGYNSLDEFMTGKFWRSNELYVDEEKVLYKALGLGKQNALGITSKEVLKRKKEADDAKVGGNWQGDGMSLGGTYVIDEGGKILLEFQQKGFGDHPSVESILESLEIPLEELKNKL